LLGVASNDRVGHNLDRSGSRVNPVRANLQALFRLCKKNGCD
jgi:hypothetical protein